ncbi:MAG: glycoside hydrolase family 28 protein [Blastocatellia bacterium]
MPVNLSRRLFTRMAPGLLTSGLLPRPAEAATPPAQISAAVPYASFNVRDFGAAGDGVHLDTYAIQSAIEACASAGGGVVWFPAGAWLSGTLYFRSGVTLHLSEGATLLGAPSLDYYPRILPAFRSYTDNYSERSLLYAENVERIGITGRGTIDGQGVNFPWPDYKRRPYLIRFVQCRDVSVSDVTMQNSPMWVQHYLACEDLRITGIRVRDKNPCCTSNHDGIDIDSCQRVRVSDCDIAAEDDGIVLKSTAQIPCRDVVITNCIVTSRHNAIKFGTESSGGFENITISNISIYDTKLAGLALEMVDGGTLQRVTISNIVMRDTACPIFIRLGNRARAPQAHLPKPGVGKVRNIVIRNVTATGADGIGSSVSGIPGYLAENITLENINITTRGGGTQADARRAIPEQAEHYPEYWIFGTLPAYGLYSRHVSGLTLRNINLNFDQPELRPAIVCDDVNNLQMLSITAESQADAEPVLRFQQVRGAFVQGCNVLRAGSTLLEVTGEKSADISLSGNGFGPVLRQVELAPEVSVDRVQSCSTRITAPPRRSAPSP